MDPRGICLGTMVIHWHFMGWSSTFRAGIASADSEHGTSLHSQPAVLTKAPVVFFLGPKKVPTWEWLKMSLYPFWKKGNETCLCWSFLNYQSMLFGVPPYLTLHCWICVGQWHTGSGPPTCKLVYNGIYIILDIYIYYIYIYILHIYLYIYDIWDMYIIIYIRR